MDYNYVRMRNALKESDYVKAEEYKRLYEGGKTKKTAFSVLDYVIAMLLSVAVLLGVYILHSEYKSAQIGSNIQETEVAE